MANEGENQEMRSLTARLREDSVRSTALQLAIKYLRNYGPLGRKDMVDWARQFEAYLKTGENVELYPDKNKLTTNQ